MSPIEISIPLKNVALDNKQQFTYEYTQHCIILVPLDVSMYQLIIIGHYLLIEESNIMIVKQLWLVSCIPDTA